MSEAHRIRCINKSDHQNAHERIRYIGGENVNGTCWKLSVQQAITGIQNGNWKFYVTVDGKNVWVVIATSRYGYKYLKTENDGEQPDDLLSLPECP